MLSSSICKILKQKFWFQVSLENAMDVMVAADMLLVPGLTRQCGVFLGTQLQIENVITVLRLARMFQLPRLEDQCVAFMAKNLDQASNAPFFSIMGLDTTTTMTSSIIQISVVIPPDLHFLVFLAIPVVCSPILD